MKNKVLCLVVCQVLKRTMAACSEVCKGCVLAAKQSEEFGVSSFYITLILEVNIYSEFPAAAVLSEE